MNDPHKHPVADALLSAAFISGRRAGLQGEPSSLAKDQPGTLEQYEWMLGWRSGNAEAAYSDAMWCAA